MLKIYVLFLTLTLSFSLFAEETISYDTALGLYKQGEYDKSSSVIKALHIAGSTTAASWYLEAHNNLKKGKDKTAVSRFYKALDLKPNDPAIVIDLVKTLLNRNQVSEAAEMLEKAVIAHPDVIDLKLLQAMVLYRNKKPKGALQIIEQVKSMAPNSVQPLLMEALIYYRLGEYESSEVSLKWALEISSGNVEVMNNLALVYEKLALQADDKNDTGEKRKKLEEALYYLEKAGERDSGNVSVLKNRERIMLRLNES